MNNIHASLTRFSCVFRHLVAGSFRLFIQHSRISHYSHSLLICPSHPIHTHFTRLSPIFRILHTSVMHHSRIFTHHHASLLHHHASSHIRHTSFTHHSHGSWFNFCVKMCEPCVKFAMKATPIVQWLTSPQWESTDDLKWAIIHSNQPSQELTRDFFTLLSVPVSSCLQLAITLLLCAFRISIYKTWPNRSGIVATTLKASCMHRSYEDHSGSTTPWFARITTGYIHTSRSSDYKFASTSEMLRTLSLYKCRDQSEVPGGYGILPLYTRLVVVPRGTPEMTFLVARVMIFSKIG